MVTVKHVPPKQALHTMSLITPPTLLDRQRWKNKRIGLLGGSFNPPHKGHVHISKIALNTLNLDYVWWLVTPLNPLKYSGDMMSYDERLAASQRIMQHPRIIVTDIERQLTTTNSYQTVLKLKKHYPHTQFAWITGMDNAHNLHLWNNWRDLLKEITMVHITRQPTVKLIRNCSVKMLSTQTHVIVDRGVKAPLVPRRTYWVLQKKMVNISSTDIRKGLVKPE